MEHRTHPLASTLADRPKSGHIGSLRYLARYLKPYRWAIAGALVAILFTSAAVLGMGAALRYLVDEGLKGGNPDLLRTSYEMLLGVTVLLAFASYGRFYLVSSIGERAVADIRTDAYLHIIRMHTGYFETTRTGELLSRLTTDTTLLQTVMGSTVSVALRNSLLLLGGVTLLLVTSTKLTGYVALILPLVVLPIVLLGRKVRGLSRETQNRVADISAHAEETIGSIRAIQALSLETFEAQRFNAHVNDALKTANRRIRTRALLISLVISLVFGAIVTVLWVGSSDVLAGRITPGELSSFVFYSVVVAGAVGALGDILGDLQRSAGATERLMEILQLTPAIAAPEHPSPLPAPLNGHIRFEDVTFHYPARPDRPALTRFTLDIAPGKTVALVGPSGAGKTTVFQLLLRLYDPERGRITLDGTNVRDLDPVTLRGCMGFVPQDPVIFSTHAWDNIRCGRLDATDEDVRAAAEAAAATEFLDKLPQGFGTFLGEKGVRLSAGQRQRIAIARAIIRNPRILLLDEATSALDSHSEQLVQQALAGLMKGRTTLVIAHRLATVLAADTIVVLNEGVIEAVGTHKELLAASPLYAKLAALQFNVAA